jgi:hypothetical protein
MESDMKVNAVRAQVVRIEAEAREQEIELKAQIK